MSRNLKSRSPLFSTFCWVDPATLSNIWGCFIQLVHPCASANLLVLCPSSKNAHDSSEIQSIVSDFTKPRTYFLQHFDRLTKCWWNLFLYSFVVFGRPTTYQRNSAVLQCKLQLLQLLLHLFHLAEWGSSLNLGPSDNFGYKEDMYSCLLWYFGRWTWVRRVVYSEIPSQKTFFRVYIH